MRRARATRLTTVVLVVAAVALSATSAAATIVTDWSNAGLEEIRRSVPRIMGPPMAARALAIVHTCIYDAWTAYGARAVPTSHALRELHVRRPADEWTDANRAQAISHAAHRCLLNLFADPALYPPPRDASADVLASRARLADVMIAHGCDPSDESVDVTTPTGIGNVAAAAVIDARRHDGANQYGDLRPGPYSDYTGYAPRNPPMAFCTPLTDICPPLDIADPLHWQPLTGPPPASATQTFIGAHWERVTPFALASAAEFDTAELGPPPDLFRNAGHYHKNVEDVLHESAGLDDARKLIVEYWADGPSSELPCGHWALFAQFVSARDRHTIDDDVKMFFAMHNASFDAGIVAWHFKRRFDGVRPITAIRDVKDGHTIRAWGGPGRPVENIRGETWMPYNPGSNLTPSFPGYYSGHSTFSRSSAEVLRRFTGSDRFGYSTVIPPNFGRVEPGIPAVPTTLTFDTFSDAANQAGLSRLYGGIHFSDDNTRGQVLGALIGALAWEKAQTYFDGSAP